MAWFSREALKHLGSSRFFKIQRRRGAAMAGRWFEYLEERTLFSATEVDISKNVPLNQPSVVFTTVDFSNAFTEPAGNTATLANVTITSLPTNGNLTLASVAVTAGETIPATELGNLTYTQTTGFNGTDSFGWQGTDSTGTPAVSAASVNINVLPVIGVPHIIVTENQSAAFTFQLFQDQFNTGPGGPALQEIEILTLPTHGTLTLSGQAVTANETISAANISNLLYTPTTYFSGTDSFQWNGSFDGTTFPADGNLFALPVPDLTPQLSNLSIPVFENQTTTLTAAEFENGFSHKVGNASLQSITVLTLPADGTLALNGTPVQANDVIDVSDLSNLTYTPTGTPFSGTDNTLTWSAFDGTYQSQPQSVTDSGGNKTTFIPTVSFVGTPPTLSNFSKVGLINTAGAVPPSTITITAADFSAHVTDPVNGGTLQEIEIVTVPPTGDGTFMIGNVTLGNNTILPISSMGNITFTPAAGFQGAASFTWKATDFVGNATQSDFFAPAATVTLNVQPPVVVSSISANVPHASPLRFSESDFDAGFVDAENLTLQSITITSLPSNGTLTLNGAAVKTGDVVSAANISNLIYFQTPGLNGSDSFGWNASDGNATGLTPATVNLTVAADAAPTVSTVSVKTQENVPLTFTEADFTAAFTDADGDTLQQIRITTLPQVGTLTLPDGKGNEIPVVMGQIISLADATNLVYTAPVGYSSADAFTWNGSDGLLFAAADASVTIQSVPPVAGPIQKTVAPGTVITLTATDFQNAFSDGIDGDPLVSVQIGTVPAHGTLTLSNSTVIGQPVTAGEIISFDSSLVLTYTPAAGFGGKDTFTYFDADDFAESAAATVTLGEAVAPTVSPIAVGVQEGTATTFTLAEFQAGFADATPNEILQTIQITSLPSNGTLTLGGNAVSAGDQISAANITNLIYTPTQEDDANGTSAFVGTDSFGWNGADDLQYAATASTVTLSVNEPPTVSNVGVVGVLAGGKVAFNAAEFVAAFSDTNLLNAGDTLQGIKITSLPTHGTLTLSGATVSAGDFIAVNNIGNLTYTPAAKFSGTDSFGWNGSDGFNFAASAATVPLAVVTTDFDVLGNNTPILSGSKTPTAATLTDFGSWSILPDATVGLDTRTYTVVNASNATITLGNITLSDTTDFKVTTALGTTTLAAGATTTFTVGFNPLLVGKHAGTITIGNSSADLPAFTFAIQGTGVHTTSIAASSSDANGTPVTGVVQEGTTQAGSGAGAVNGQVLEIKYTGYLAVGGQIFDATSLDGGTPFEFRLDDDFANSQPFITSDQVKNFLLPEVDGGVIPGWEYGLQGIKQGEKRTLVISAQAAYGGTPPTGSIIPADAVLIFDVQCVSLVTKPQLQVDATDSNGPTALILPGQKTVSADDNTLFTLSNASSSSATFQLVNVGTDNAAGAPVDSWSFRGRGVTVSGDAREFGVSVNSGVLTVTFHPIKTGTRKATIRILTTDPLHPTFTFDVEGQSTASTDLVDGFNRLHFPKTAVTSGTSQLITLPVLVENIGNSAVPSRSKTNLQVYAVDSSGDKTLVDFKNNINLAGLGVDKISHQTVTFPLPASLASGAYTFTAEVNQSSTESNATLSVPVTGTPATFTEIATGNDSATTSTSVTVIQGVNALAGTLGTSTLVHSASGVNGKVTVNIQNLGTLTVPKDQAATVDIVAHPVGTSDTSGDVTLASALPVSLSLLGVHGTRAFPLSVAFSGAIASGLYDIEVTLTPSTTLSGVGTVSADANAQGNPVLLTV